jgi:Uma2 family endonuclease
MPAAPMPIPEIAEAAPARKRFTREEVDRLDATGVFDGERYELIDGDLIDKMGQNPPHAFVICLLLKCLAGLFEGDLIGVQHPMEAAPGDRERSLPEPDVAVLRERNIEHQSRHPRGDEMLLVIEVSDTTAAFDRSRKARLYARAGVPEYWVLDLNGRMLVVHREPDGTQYRQTFLRAPEETVPVPGRSETIRVADILPPA